MLGFGDGWDVGLGNGVLLGVGGWYGENYSVWIWYWLEDIYFRAAVNDNVDLQFDFMKFEFY